MYAAAATELLGECNHVGCPDSPVMLAQLSADIARGDSDNAIFHQFQEQYGPVVLASPRFTRFNHLAWIMPPLVLFLGIGCVLLDRAQLEAAHRAHAGRRRIRPALPPPATVYAGRPRYESAASRSMSLEVRPR